MEPAWLAISNSPPLAVTPRDEERQWLMLSHGAPHGALLGVPRSLARAAVCSASILSAVAADDDKGRQGRDYRRIEPLQPGE